MKNSTKRPNVLILGMDMSVICEAAGIKPNNVVGLTLKIEADNSAHIAVTEFNPAARYEVHTRDFSFPLSTEFINSLGKALGISRLNQVYRITIEGKHLSDPVRVIIEQRGTGSLLNLDWATGLNALRMLLSPKSS